MQTAAKKYFTIDEKIFAELVRLLYKQASSAIIGSLFTAACVFFGIYPYVSKPRLVTWFIALLVVSAIRIQVTNVYASKKRTIEDAAYWHKVFWGVTIASGLIWMLISSFLMSSNGINETLITIAVVGVSAGSVPYFASSRTVAATFILLILPFFILKMSLYPDETHRIIAVMSIVYMGLLLTTIYRIHHEIYGALRFKFENDDLIHRLSDSKNEIENINKELKLENMERKEVEQLLRNREEQYRLVTNALPVLIAYIDNDWVFRFNNSAYESWFNKALSDITNKPIKEIIGETAFNNFKDHYAQLQAGKQVTYETAMYFHEEQERFVSVSLIPHLQDKTMLGIFSLISDVTPRINFLATHDALTNLPNRSLFTVRFTHALNQATQNGSKLALLFLDLDHFKNVNDTLGHDVGDQLLIKVVERLQGCVRERDTIARLGGDEFIILLHIEDDVNRPAMIAKKICNVLSMGFRIDDKDIFVTTSIGISIYPDDGMGMGVLLKNADMAMYRAKGRGRNTYEFYTHGMNELMQKKLKIETCLRGAIERNELKIYYQPIIDIKTREIHGLESLLRWHHPEMGLIPPRDFISIAEETDLIIPIGDWVLETVCQQTAILKRMGYPNLNLSVNISARQFNKKDLSKRVQAILEKFNVDGRSITLELTESLIMNDIDHSMRVVNELKKLNIEISIDDFGTGYSSLNYLKSFPFDILKIDRSFVTNFAINQEDAAIVKAIITLAHNLKMKTVAEGVETVEQFNFLHQNNCDSVQGFLLYPPLPEAELQQILQKATLEDMPEL